MVFKDCLDLQVHLETKVLLVTMDPMVRMVKLVPEDLLAMMATLVLKV